MIISPQIQDCRKEKKKMMKTIIVSVFVMKQANGEDVCMIRAELK